MSAATEDLQHVIQSVRNKYLLAKRMRMERDSVLEDTFRPILNKIDSLKQPSPSDQLDIKEENPGIEPAPCRHQDEDDLPLAEFKRRREVKRNADYYLKTYKSALADRTYGIYKKNKKWYIGNKQIYFLPNDKIQVGTSIITPASGLFELLFKARPRHYTQAALGQYKRLLAITSAHLRNNDPHNFVFKDLSHPKFAIVSDLFPNITAAEGSGYFNNSKIENNRSFEYVYYDDVNELIARLRLLIASDRAGNHSHRNEAQNIIEELREAGFIV